MTTSQPARAPRSIALDGPAASGKSSVGGGLAHALGYMLFDTGMLYRCLTLMAIRASVPFDHGTQLADLAAAHDIAIEPRPSSTLGFVVRVDGEDVTASLRTAAVDASVSPVSAHAGVRAALLEAQRRVARENAVVMVGRDIGTVVLPDADLKVYLAASAQARARRRFRERLADGEPEAYAEILASLEARDAYDSGRPVAPLRAARDAVIVVTDACRLADVIAHVLGLVRRWPDTLTTGGGSAPCVGRGAASAS